MNQYRNRVNTGFGNLDMNAFANQNKRIAQAQISQASAGSALEDYTQKITMPLAPIAGGASAAQKIKATGQKIQEKYQKIKQGIQDTKDKLSPTSNATPSKPAAPAPQADDKSILPDFDATPKAVPAGSGPPPPPSSLGPTQAPPPPPSSRPPAPSTAARPAPSTDDPLAPQSYSMGQADQTMTAGIRGNATRAGQIQRQFDATRAPSNGNAPSAGQLQPDNPVVRPNGSAGHYDISPQGGATDVGRAGGADMNDPFQAPRSLMNQKMSVQTLSGGQADAQNTLGQMRNRIGGNPMVQNAHAAINSAGDDAMDAAGKVASGASKAAEGVYSAIGVAGDVMDALGPIGDLIGLGLGIFGGVEAHKEQEQKEQATAQAQQVASEPTLKTSGAAVTSSLDTKGGQSANIHY